MQPQTDPPAAPTHSRTFLGHPVGLYVLFLTQMWERFSYFGMLGMLILYLREDFKLSQDSASAIFKWYTSAIFLTPLVGGFLADRWLGNKRSVVIGAAFMAIGHFLMAIPTLPAVYAAMAFLCVGFGFLTPPMTSQVGLLYPPGDARRDSAYTIFYMGINLGAFISPLICGWLVENTRGGYHSGLTVPGLGMVIALITYVVGLRWIVEVDQGAATSSAEPSEHITATPNAGSTSEERAEQTPSAAPLFNQSAPMFLVAVGLLLAVAGIGLFFTGFVSLDNFVGLELAALASFVFAWVTAEVRQGLRDRVLAILLLFFFAVVYWVGAGQYGNAINLWADQNTNRFLTRAPDAPGLFPEAAETAGAGEEAVEPVGLLQRWIDMFKLKTTKADDSATSWLDPVPTIWFQSINPLMILLLAPLFAMLWTRLDRVGLNPSIPIKMALGLVFMTLAFVFMVGGAWREARPSSVPLKASALPAPLVVNAQGQVCKAEEGKPPVPYAAGRLYYEQAGGSLRAVGVFPDSLRDEIVADTAPSPFVEKIEELQKKAEEAAKGPKGWKVQVQLDPAPSQLDLRYAGLGAETGNPSIRYDPATRTLTATIELEEKEIKGLKVAAGDPHLRASLNELMLQADASRVSPWWLVGFFFLATIGELCLTPVGLSMVSQLAPARFATMLMGLWLLTWTFANFIAGALGEKWGTWTPMNFFMLLLVIMGGATLLLFAISRKVGSLMHEGK